MKPNQTHDAQFMQRAIALAAQGTRAVRPNPRVGCVLVQGRKIVGEGFHAQAGGPHAEAVALAQAGDRARGATAYVTLEPCNHTGKTPPCAQALIAAGVQRVVVGVHDPHPLAAGGKETLEAAGIPVDMGVELQACLDVAEVFLTGIHQKRPFVHWKIATTLDGRIAAEDGTTRWISCPESRVRVHQMRAEADAVLIGSGTALADDPRLDLRELPQATTLPLRVVLDRRLRLKLESHLAETQQQKTLVVTDSQSRAESEHADLLRAKDVEILLVPAGDSWLRTVLETLAARGIQDVLCESGRTLGTALWREGLVDRLELVLAPRLLGSGTLWLESLGIPTLDSGRPLRFAPPQLVGQDLWVTARPVR